jgi:uncharacterized membrane protein YccF (DUF307 family)
VPPYPGLQLELDSYAGKLRTLSIVWFIYGGLSLALGFVGLAFADAFMSGRFHYWMHGPLPPFWMGPAFLHFIWVFIAARSALALLAGWGLMQRTAWGRIVAIVAAFLIIIKIPFGTALAIWTLVTLLGYRNTVLYEQLPEA